MRVVFALIFFSTALSSCVTTPPLEQATGEEQGGVMIKDVVQRVKCELSDAFDEKAGDPGFYWLASWTAKVDLTLTINDTAGISPSGSYTRFQGNAVNRDAGPSTFPATAARSVVNQFLTVSASANLSGQAVRTETISFSVALDELKLWRKHIELMESKLPEEKRICFSSGKLGVRGNLGLREWVDSAFFSVSEGELKAGIHPAPLSLKAGTVPSAAGVSGQISHLEKAKPNFADMKKTVTEVFRDTTTFYASKQVIDGSVQSIKTASTSLQTKIVALKASLPQYKGVLENYLKVRFAHFALYQGAMAAYSANASLCSNRVTSGAQNSPSGSEESSDSAVTGASANAKGPQKYVDEAFRLATEVRDKINEELRKGGTEPSSDLQQKYSELQDAAKKVSDGNYVESTRLCVPIMERNARDALVVANSLPDQLDLPVDSILHSVQFVLNYGAGISPSWTLLQWKGPGASGGLFGVSGIRTHNLQIALGPRNGKANASEDAIRLIQNQTVQNLKN